MARDGMAVFDILPPDVRRAINECEFLVDINNCPRGFAWKKVGVVEKINAVKTFDDAARLDAWLLTVGLRSQRR